MAATDADTAEKARISGNEFYKTGQLAKAERAYQIAVSLAPQDAAPVSNLSAVKYEMGDYQGSITHIKQALALDRGSAEDSVRRDKLNARLAKCSLYLRDVSSAKGAISAVSNQDLGAELLESLESTLALQADAPEEYILRRQILDHVPQYKSWLDYIGGHLTTFLVVRPLLNENSRSCIRFNNLLNPPEFEDHEAFQSEYLLMHDMAQIRKHFLVERRPAPANPRDEFLKSMMSNMYSAFAFEGDMTWKRLPKTQMSYKDLLPRAAFEKWMHGHLLKICVPCPRPIFSGAPVYAPLNLTTLIRLMVSMFEIGYPAHWLLIVFSQICSGTLTTTARPPIRRVTNSADVDAKHPPKVLSVQPWVAEFTTLLSIWRSLIPFGVDSLGGALVPLSDINQYSIDFPPFRAENERLPHFALLFWNTEIGYTVRPPNNLHSLLSGGNSGTGAHTPAKELLEKAIVMVTAFQYISDSRSVVFSMRADTMEEMKSGKWRAFILRTDAWHTVTDGVDVSQKVVTRENWTALV